MGYNGEKNDKMDTMLGTTTLHVTWMEFRVTCCLVH